MSKNDKRKAIYGVIALAITIVLYFVYPYLMEKREIVPINNSITAETISDVLKAVPEYSSESFVTVNNNEPFFDTDKLGKESFEEYGELDKYGRCTYAFACIGKDTMPIKERKSISHIYPTGWEQKKYNFVDGKSLYNRCHLIGHQLSGEDANKQNLITGTRYMNAEGMLPFENMVADYIKETDNHVVYRVTPLFEGDNLLASGVLMEAYSIEDEGDGICFNVYCYNVQPGVVIDYATGKNHKE